MLQDIINLLGENLEFKIIIDEFKSYLSLIAECPLTKINNDDTKDETSKDESIDGELIEVIVIGSDELIEVILEGSGETY